MAGEPAEIRIGGAREHNLKNVSLSIPRNKLVVFTGVSGSGKSSLVFDTLFAEGQRKYVESISSYARQFLNQLQKPDVDYIEGLSPAIAIEQRHNVGNPRSTISTTTEIYDYLRLLFAHAGQPHCPESGLPIQAYTASDIIQDLLSHQEESRLILLAPVVKNQKGEFKDVLDRMSREGFIRARIDGVICDLTEKSSRPKLDPQLRHNIEIVIDRLVIRDKHRARLADSVETSLRIGDSDVIALTQSKETTNRDEWNIKSYSLNLVSPTTLKQFELPTPRHFSFNSPLGACEECQGLGSVTAFDPDHIIPSKNKSLKDGAILPWKDSEKAMQPFYNSLAEAIYSYLKVDEQTTISALSQAQTDFILYGDPKSEKGINLRPFLEGKKSNSKKAATGPLLFSGVITSLIEKFTTAESETSKRKLKKYMSLEPCRACQGGRLKPELLAVTLNHDNFPIEPKNQNIPGYSIFDINSLTIEQTFQFFQNVSFSSSIKEVALDIVNDIKLRLKFLIDVGLGYLGLDREFGTLSGGESQRIRLATQIGAGLVGVLYILDEPSIGLHQKDNDRLLKTLESLRDKGNSVVVVEHDEDTIRRADYLVDVGPGPGKKGGEIVASGTVSQVLQDPNSITAKYLTGQNRIEVPKNRVLCRGMRPSLNIFDAHENNLQNLDVRIPLGAFVCVTGVSGSGKSTLINDVLCKALFKYFYKSNQKVGLHREITGMEHINKVVVVDQTAIGKSPRSNPATFTGIFSEIRDVFAQLPASKIRGYGPGRFSFNNKGGRCERCQGDGALKVEMHFLPPVFIKCEACNGKRYNRETLEVTYKGLNIADILELTIDEAIIFFRSFQSIATTCETMSAVGLGYLQLGQSATTLSGGESQRLKLASELKKKSIGSTLYILDEPTTGLHFQDVETLLDVFFKLRDAGGTILVIEHNLDVIKTADWLIDLGPGGGSLGGRIIAEGTPESVAEHPQSITGTYLKPILLRDTN